MPRTKEAKDLKPGMRVRVEIDGAAEISTITAVDITAGADPYGSVQVAARREGDLPAGMSRTWTCADEPWNEYQVI